MEKPDSAKNLNVDKRNIGIYDSLVIGYNESLSDDDISSLTIARRNTDGSLTLIKTLFRDEAIQLYSTLISSR